MSTRISSLAARMDQLYEFDREPVAANKLQGGAKYAGLFAGEHVAATEFVIGAFFVLHGVSAKDLLAGLLIGNLLAVLSWTFLCAPIAVRTRLTLYWYLRKIAGPGLTLVYNIANGLLYCILAGAMISVAASAVGLAFGIQTPALNDVYPNSLEWIVLTVSIGLAFTVLAILGFEKLSRFAQVCSPWIFVIFIAGAVATLPKLGIHASFDNFWPVVQERVWNGVPSSGQEAFHIWHVVFFAWFANLAMHVGLSDMALFRYAKSWTYGLYSAFGMYPGHMLAWICSGIMVAGVNREMNPGLMAYQAAGLAGMAAVVVAGWTTANPTLYRVGLALQTVTPNWPRWRVTLAAGVVTSILSTFPAVFTRLLDYVAIYGLVLMPVGAIVLAEHWILPRLGLAQYQAEARRQMVNWKAAVVWAGTLAVCAVLPMHLYFRWLPGYLIALISYCLLQKAFGDKLNPAAAETEGSR
jgi:purine-cytosine permease-like protein